MITLREIEYVRVIHGAYKITAEIRPHVGSGARGMLEIAHVNIPVVSRLVHRGPTADIVSLMDAHHLPALLHVCHQKHLWSKKVEVVFSILQNGKKVSSNAVSLQTPVKPALDCDYRLATDSSLLYPHEGKNPVGRSIFHVRGGPKLPGGYYFVHGGKFETNPNYRGLDCTTFARAILGVPSDLLVRSGEDDKIPILGQLKLNLETTAMRRDPFVGLLASGVYEDGLIMIRKGESVHHFAWWRKGDIYEFNFPSAGKKHELQPTKSRGAFVTPVKNWRKHDKENTFSLRTHGSMNDGKRDEPRRANIA